ncbi:hypothetical protein R1sor_018275 [Riccia sorocarpa]|uniref:Uncharacterized protein n=1 Tax=Riccia sorocarpa TaxID=122646 RepID=A0ABD3I977_9MARC
MEATGTGPTFDRTEIPDLRGKKQCHANQHEAQLISALQRVSLEKKKDGESSALRVKDDSSESEVEDGTPAPQHDQTRSPERVNKYNLQTLGESAHTTAVEGSNAEDGNDAQPIHQDSPFQRKGTDRIGGAPVTNNVHEYRAITHEGAYTTGCRKNKDIPPAFLTSAQQQRTTKGRQTSSMETPSWLKDTDERDDGLTENKAESPDVYRPSDSTVAVARKRTPKKTASRTRPKLQRRQRTVIPQSAQVLMALPSLTFGLGHRTGESRPNMVLGPMEHGHGNSKKRRCGQEDTATTSEPSLELNLGTPGDQRISRSE